MVNIQMENQQLKNNWGGARKGAGRKKIAQVPEKLQAHYNEFFMSLLDDEEIRKEVFKDLSTVNQSPDEYVYFLKERGTGSIKIGYTSSIKARFKAYNTSMTNFDCIYLHKTDDAFRLEGSLHDLFASKLVKGEWFNLSESDILAAIKFITNWELSKL